MCFRSDLFERNYCVQTGQSMEIILHEEVADLERVMILAIAADMICLCVSRSSLMDTSFFDFASNFRAAPNCAFLPLFFGLNPAMTSRLKSRLISTLTSWSILMFGTLTRFSSVTKITSVSSSLATFLTLT